MQPIVLEYIFMNADKSKDKILEDNLLKTVNFKSVNNEYIQRDTKFKNCWNYYTYRNNNEALENIINIYRECCNRLGIKINNINRILLKIK